MTEIRAPYTTGPPDDPKTGWEPPFCTRRVAGEGRHWVQGVCPLEPDTCCSPEPPWPPRLALCGGCFGVAPRFSDLMVLARSGIEPGDPGHGVDFYEWALRGCGGCGAAVLHRWVHDCFGKIEDETLHWRLGAEDAGRLRALISTECPAPLEPACGCALHVALLASCRELPRPGWPTGPIALSPGEPWQFVTLSTRQGGRAHDDESTHQ